MTYYHGRTPGVVEVVNDDAPGTAARYPLPHLVKHSPTGFSWGYGGSGPADLARCLLINALGDAAVCQTCEGTGWVTEGPDGLEVPAHKGENSWNCFHCEDGIAVIPAMYQDFKWQIVAKLPQKAGWTLTKSEIMDWHRGWLAHLAGTASPWSNA
jgi:hypothetical protein